MQVLHFPEAPLPRIRSHFGSSLFGSSHCGSSVLMASDDEDLFPPPLDGWPAAEDDEDHYPAPPEPAPRGRRSGGTQGRARPAATSGSVGVWLVQTDPLCGPSSSSGAVPILCRRRSVLGFGTFSWDFIASISGLGRDGAGGPVAGDHHGAHVWGTLEHRVVECWKLERPIGLDEEFDLCTAMAPMALEQVCCDGRLQRPRTSVRQFLDTHAIDFRKILELNVFTAEDVLNSDGPYLLKTLPLGNRTNRREFLLDLPTHATIKRLRGERDV